MKKRKASLSTLREKAWKTFSAFIRQKHANHAGECACVTCGTWRPWQELHAGHFVHASRQSPLSYDERNVHPQCPQCNYYGMQGLAMINYTQFIIGKYGEAVVEELKAMKHAKTYLRRSELETVIARYR